MTTSDPDLQTFLGFARGRLDINALGKDWESEFVRSIQALRSESLKHSFRRGFAKSVLGQLSPEEYERATGWTFDTDADFRDHLRKYWRLFYGSDDPAESL